jgi:antirestriction protein ArdC
MYAWNQLGRRVNKGEKGIRILAPILGIRRKPDAEAEKDIRVENERVLVGFRNAYVFDVEQTTGADLAEPAKVYGEVGENYERLLAFLERQDIELVFTENIAPALGASYGGRIAILPGQSKAETFTTLLHELGHELLMHASRRTTTTKTVRETEAEAVAFVVGKAIGLEMASASADYIALYHGNASLLAESLEVVQQTAGVILAALENPFEQKAQEESTTEPARESRRTRRHRPQPADADASESLAEVA